MIAPIILSGGSGTRLWPLSRKLHPKQFIDLVNDTTLFQDTILRLPDNVANPLIICNEDHRFLAAEQLRQIDKESNGIILEPIGKNTAPAIALAALKFINKNEDPLLLVLSADHLIQDTNAFHQSIKIAEELAQNNKLVTFGIVPDKAETGYGYIKADIDNPADYYKIQSFTEKPNEKDAQLYLDSGNYFWNSGMFMFKASIYLQELEKFEPEILASCKKSCRTEYKDKDFIRLNNDEFYQCPEQSVDYAVMEHTEDGVVVPLDANWSDIGSWNALWDAKDKDSNGNVSEGDVILDKVKNTYIYSSNRLISAIGISDLVIVDTQDALLVTDKKYSQNIKHIVNRLKKDARPEADDHRKVFRPWGYYDSIDSNNGFQVKRILVNPGAKLSLQKHQHRAEHWVVVKGVATITRGDDVFVLKENQSTYIPKDKIHRLENQEKIDLEIIEIQTGDYLGEDDIIRLEDDYQRN
ncbi:Mannose-1-phosphate guanylyltransferase (EC 2.7.7.13) / Mannose-6-phosphate isomerase (EC 5.3.1.8) [uncultured Gammaproteobacteria bacterium]|uniref:mannose-1-phosphate guanylyltransferase/mannose-6-phosphate isomerase n=1 Tax=Bathymodiolus heckerae thiotrophic gill symbiont TaxID=1052212 RepID=UPI0010B458A0|nr:mannose-1-phosphate guanylyltransferase/mannose-6-phosphate isomerase [Bathymodiolus heckerae thiotrophic gill symbiont]CAC9605623.1 Mannose-1-phosphate guanylyltransferase (EC 2.7.7.13) / Mannose-6-phosphate isomerase (EC 5.3.1.8) [uncultured Gammaproteobacteria bacterium]CAC9606863.1 Mannose-1-phosphate guanylyltransferase (EC 2.7.7.13) / Mannose-6-phosphate isomerase (EC 5.3.1.8) [uncultured Gammaproteobacteria bacterium]SHN91015.1 Mannose-1-phosphate guanylyltransferase (GDP) [Bathymodiol